MTLLVDEIFGPTIQGEGDTIGTPTIFIRLGGCDYRCVWAVTEEATILDGNLKEIKAKEIAVGDEIFGQQRDRSTGIDIAKGNWQVGKVVEVDREERQTYDVTFANGQTISVTEEHRFVRWGEGIGGRFVNVQNLKQGDLLKGFYPFNLGRYVENDYYKKGYLTGASEGDGCFTVGDKYQIATKDKEIIERIADYLDYFDVHYTIGQHQSGGDFAPMKLIPILRVTSKSAHNKLYQLTHEFLWDNIDFVYGYLAGIYDTDGSTDGSTIGITQKKERVLKNVLKMFSSLNLDYTKTGIMYRIKGGRAFSRALLQRCQPALMRKRLPLFVNNKATDVLEVKSVRLGTVKTAIGIKTDIGTYVADGILHSNCDSLHAVLPENKDNWVKLTPTEIVNQVNQLAKGSILVTISGGNPALQDLSELIDLLHIEGHKVTIETQASVAKDWMSKLDFMTLSPKPPSAKTKQIDRIDLCLRKFGERDGVSLKVVVFDERDLQWAISIFDKYPHVPKFISIGNNVGYDTTNDLLSALADFVELCMTKRLYNVRILPQLHVLLWGNKRGV